MVDSINHCPRGVVRVYVYFVCVCVTQVYDATVVRSVEEHLEEQRQQLLALPPAVGDLDVVKQRAWSRIAAGARLVDLGRPSLIESVLEVSTTPCA